MGGLKLFLQIQRMRAYNFGGIGVTPRKCRVTNSMITWVQFFFLGGESKKEVGWGGGAACTEAEDGRWKPPVAITNIQTYTKIHKYTTVIRSGYRAATRLIPRFTERIFNLQ